MIKQLQDRLNSMGAERWEYLILADSDRLTLCQKVNELMEKGWRPQGGVTVSMTSGVSGVIAEIIYAQALILP